MWLRTLYAVGFVVCAGFASACSGGDDDDNDNDDNGSTSGGPSGGAEVSCDLVSLGTVMSTLGVTGLGSPERTVSLPLTSCVYHGASTVIITYQTGMSRADFDSQRANIETRIGGPATDVPGVGEAAYGSISGTIAAVTAFSGSTIVQVSAPSTLEQEAQLINQILPKL